MTNKVESCVPDITFLHDPDSGLAAKVFRRTVGERQEWAFVISDPEKRQHLVTDAPTHQTQQAAMDAAQSMLDGMVPNKHDPE